MADELNNDASELMRAARIPHTTKPFTPAGRIFATNVGKAASLIVTPFASTGRKVPPDFTFNAYAIIPGIRKMNTGSSFR